MRQLRMRKAVLLGALGWMLTLSTVACTEKGLYGLELGVSLAVAQAAYAPAVEGGTWAREGDSARIGGEKLLPNETTLFLEGDSVVGLRMRFDKTGIVAADEHPLKLPQTFRAKQSPDGAKGPFEHSGTKLWLDETTVYSFAKDSDGFTVERFSRRGLAADADGCEAADSMAARLGKKIEAAFGEDGARTREERLAATARLRPLAAAVELLCPESSGILTVVGDFFQASGAANGALERYKKAMKLADGWGAANISDAHAGIGAVSFQYRKDDQAAEHYRLAIERASNSGQRAKVARGYADDLHARELYPEAAKYYATYLESTASTDHSDLARINARLLRATIEQPGGCKKAEPVAERGLALDQASPRARAAMLAAEAFRIIACDPKKKKDGYQRLEEAVKLDPLMAAEWSRLTAYYDREAQDDMVLKIMVEQGWLDPKGLSAAREYQKEVRGTNR